MDSQTISQGASGNQANHNSIQVNGAVGDRVQIRRALIKTLKISTPQVTAPSSSTIKDDFYFGPIPALEEDQDEGFESETMQDLTPGISEADFHQISKTNTSLMENYKMLLKRTPNMKATCVKQLRDKAGDQQIRIKFHVTQVQQWFTATGNSGQIQVSMSDSSVEDLKQRLASICSKLQDAINSLPRGPTRSRGRSTLVGLVPVQEYEPLCINPNDVAVTGHHVAIESNFNKGDYIWFEAHSRLVLPKDDGDAVYSEPSSPLVTVINGLRQRWRRDSGYSSVTAASSDERSQTSQNITEFCRIQVCPGSLAQGSDRLAMCIAVDQDSGHQIFYLDENKRPKTSCKPLTLSKIIREGEHGRLLSNKRKKHRRYVTLFHRSRSLRNSRFKLALKLAEATIRYGWQEWLGDGWGTQDIKFYPIESEKMPFLRATMFDHGSTRPKRFMYHLGHVLLKLGLWKELKGPIIQQQLDKELSRLGTETSVQYQEAVRYCIAHGESSSDEQSDYETFQRNFYQSVISPLREMVKRGEMDDMECQETID
ncbi:hypothetical protein FPRO06_07630 [Fusarium proliferatum]|nr:hypothetical protein FPRO06_07630 [Fusarium proliferatum]